MRVMMIIERALTQTNSGFVRSSTYCFPYRRNKVAVRYHQIFKASSFADNTQKAQQHKPPWPNNPTRVLGWNPQPFQAENNIMPETVDEGLQWISTAMGLQNLQASEHIHVFGRAMVDGMLCHWTMRWCMDGRFFERISNNDFTHDWGHDGKRTWYTDAAGRVARLELDEGEICLLCAWVRTGFWVTNEARRFLDVRLEDQESAAVERLLGSQLAFSIKIKNRKVVVYVIVDRRSWLPVGVSYRRFCFKDKWIFSSWRYVLSDRSCQLPIDVTYSSSSLGQRYFTIMKVAIDPMEDATGNGTVYSYPTSLFAPRYNPRCPRVSVDKMYTPVVQMIKSKYGHYLVRPLIDGKDIGFFVVDTGTGGLAITQAKARELGLSNFGEVYVQGISGGAVTRTKFSRGKSFELGCFKMTDPKFLVVDIDRLLKGVAGLCGFDIFYGTIVEMSFIGRTLSLYDPAEYETFPRAKNLRWQRMILFDNVPHVEAKVNGREVLLMLDTGAVGTYLMFPNSSVEGFDEPEADMPYRLRGRKIYVSQADYGNVSDFEVAGHTFKNVTAIVSRKSGQGLGLSEYCDGVLCGEMATKFIFVLDYAKHRIAFLDCRELRSIL